MNRVRPEIWSSPKRCTLVRGLLTGRLFLWFERLVVVYLLLATYEFVFCGLARVTGEFLSGLALATGNPSKAWP